MDIALVGSKELRTGVSLGECGNEFFRSFVEFAVVWIPRFGVFHTRNVLCRIRYTTARKAVVAFAS